MPSDFFDLAAIVSVGEEIDSRVTLRVLSCLPTFCAGWPLETSRVRSVFDFPFAGNIVLSMSSDAMHQKTKGC